MTKVIAVIDIGKTNKKILLFDEEFDVVYRNATRFDEISDDDGFPCDDIESIENWIQNEIIRIQEEGDYSIKAINFSTHGASLIYLDENGNRVTPLYNYLKPLDVKTYHEFYETNGGEEEFSRKTASPAYGMLNTGLQILKLKKEKPEFWSKVVSILHYPQYLSYLFTKQITADFTSVGAHTATWDFDNMEYHKWVLDSKLNLPIPQNGKEAIITTFNGQEIAIGKGLHDSSSSIIPLLENEKNKNKEFILLSTGTWIIAMNPFSKESLTQHQLKNNCLCFMTPEKQQIKSSMQFLGKIHEVYLSALSTYYKEDINKHLHLQVNKNLCQELIHENSRVFLSEGIDDNFEAQPNLLAYYVNYETAYYQLVFEISKKVINGIKLISDKNSSIKDVYISGGFNKNLIFITFLKLLKSDIRINISDCKNESALGAALMMKSYL
ncbi:FGGY family carbohydrate kinase [uncultured Polaribacter sp.]|uniref:FGGY family carbohydrate kinase n=1 Tax=uncultured Polaribacter sp. TaxID=174711 RepID=UPI00262D9FBC|nr:FGGY family carbohydrate kinase [uncultured Polaribacter sp.]